LFSSLLLSWKKSLGRLSRTKDSRNYWLNKMSIDCAKLSKGILIIKQPGDSKYIAWWLWRNSIMIPIGKS
jgi:hypothetical protein